MNKPIFIIVAKSGFKDLTTRTFEQRIGGKIFQGFVVKKNDKFYAYQNLCQHLPITLDLKDNQFFSHDKRFLQCHMHGALYEVESGLCVSGPCHGAKLIALEVEEEETKLLIKIAH